jgi:hypothetical protein
MAQINTREYTIVSSETRIHLPNLHGPHLYRRHQHHGILYPIKNLTFGNVLNFTRLNSSFIYFQPAVHFPFTGNKRTLFWGFNLITVTIFVIKVKRFTFSLVYSIRQNTGLFVIKEYTILNYAWGYVNRKLHHFPI